MHPGRFGINIKNIKSLEQATLTAAFKGEDSCSLELLTVLPARTREVSWVEIPAAHLFAPTVREVTPLLPVFTRTVNAGRVI